jgi:hypothetical protein
MCNVMLLVALATPICMTNTPNTQNEHYGRTQWRCSCILSSVVMKFASVHSDTVQSSRVQNRYMFQFVGLKMCLLAS